MVAEIESAGRFEILLPFFSFWKVFSLLLFFALLEDLNSLYFEISFFVRVQSLFLFPYWNPLFERVLNHLSFSIGPWVYSRWKDRSNFLPPKKWSFCHRLSTLDCFRPILAIYGPFEHLGGSRGSFGCFRGSAPTKYAIIFQGLVKALEWIVLFLRFWVKMGPSGPK